MNPIKWNDAWTGPDKVGHFRHGFVIGLGAAVFAGLLMPVSLTFALAAGLAVAVAAAGSKEFYDLFAAGRTPSPQDFLVTVAGGPPGALAGVALVAAVRSLA